MFNFIDSDLKKRIKSGIIISSFTVLLIYFLINLGNIVNFISIVLDALKYLFYGIVIAYVLNQPMKFIEKMIVKKCKENSFLYKKKRGVSIFLTIILMILLLALIASIVIPNLIESLISLISNISSFLVNIFDNIDEIFKYLKIDFRMEDIGSVKELINMPWQETFSHILSILTKSAGGIMANATNFLAKFGAIFSGFTFSLYLLGDKEKFILQLRKIIGAIFGYQITKIIFNYGHRVNQIF